MKQHNIRQSVSYTLISNLRSRKLFRIQNKFFYSISLAVLMLFNSGCSEKQDTIYTVKIDCEYHTPSIFFPIKIFLNDQEKGVLKDCEDSLQINEAELKGKDVYASGVFKTQVSLPEGWADVTATNVFVTPTKTSHALSASLRLESESRPDVFLYIDNRGNSASEFSIGQIKRPLKPYSHYIARVAAPVKEEALRINDTVLGMLPTAGSLETSGHIFFLVDTSGKGKYRLSCVYYSTFGSGLPNTCKGVKRLEGKHFYQLDAGLDYFLIPAPTTRGAPGMSFELLDANTK